MNAHALQKRKQSLPTTVEHKDSMTAIRGHTNNLTGMKKACWAVFYHSLSTDERPQHHCCPEGADSLCKYQRALALNQAGMPPHTPKIPADFEKYLKPILTIYVRKSCYRNVCLGPRRIETRVSTNWFGLGHLKQNSLARQPLRLLPVMLSLCSTVVGVNTHLRSKISIHDNIILLFLSRPAKLINDFVQ